MAHTPKCRVHQKMNVTQFQIWGLCYIHNSIFGVAAYNYAILNVNKCGKFRCIAKYPKS